MIPLKIREKLALNPRMKRCCYCGSSPVEWHHSLNYEKNLQEEYAIQPLCIKCHRGEFGTINKKAKEHAEYLAIKEGLEHLEKNYPKKNWRQRLKYLEYANKNKSS